jgi:uncharacterized protein (DUF2336 family)
MITWLKRKISHPETAAKKLSYDEAREALETHAYKVREHLAGQEGVEPEILYFLASDQSVIVRRKVAANPSTPQQANKILTSDNDDDVRCELARKIGRLVPGLDPSEASRVRDLAIEVMERLARDSLPRVRAILSEEIKSSDRVPAYIVKQLAQDLELIVCAPVLEYSPLLSDEDLIEIVAGARVEGGLAAIAKRTSVSEPVCDALVASFDVSAIAMLLANPNAQFREDALDRVIEHASEIEAWHQPVVMRADLSLRAVRRIAGFVSSSLIRLLSERGGLDEETAGFLSKRVRERLEYEGVRENSASAEDYAKAAVESALAAGKLDDEFVLEAIEAGDRRTVSYALVALSKLPKSIVDRILVSQSGKAITALAWRARLSMRVAVKVQSGIARLPGTKLLLAREGVHFPLTQDEMNWHLGYFGANA